MRTKKNEDDHVLRSSCCRWSGWGKVHAAPRQLYRKPAFNAWLGQFFLLTLLAGLVAGCVSTQPLVEIASPKPIEKIAELELQTILFNQLGNHQWSGLTLHGAMLLAVSDRDPVVFQLKLHPKGFTPVEVMRFDQFAGYKEYAAQLRSNEPLAKKVVDPEGISFCDQKYFVVNEVKRHVMVFDLPTKTFSYRHRDHEVMQLGVRNAGLEGIAVDCNRGVTVVAKEREPQGLFVYSKLENQTEELSHITLPGSWRSAQVVISPVNQGQSMLHVGDNYSGLYLQWPHLYVLNRPNHTIVKYDLKNNKVVGRRSYFSPLRTLYNDPYPFGLAEGLVMSEKRIFIVVDNNKLPLSKVGLKMGGKKDQSSLLIFDRGDF